MITDSRQALAGVEAVLSGFLSERTACAALAGPSYQRLWEGISSAVEGGKRVRPQLLLLAHGELGGDQHESAATAAAAFELLHTALLLHDDALDGDLQRRGRPNLQGIFAAEGAAVGLGPEATSLWSNAAGIVAGDLLISGAHALVSGIGIPDRDSLHAVIDECLFATAAGELADVGLAVGTIEATPEAIRGMMHDKTAVYSFAAPLRAGALLAHARIEVEAELAEIGAMLGLLYQLRDDLLGVFGTPEILGKSTHGDLREGKRTLLVAHAEGTNHWQEVRHLFGHAGLTDDEAGMLRHALVASGARERTETDLKQACEETCSRISRSTLPLNLAAQLTALAYESVERHA